jgi:hypothetical protein
MTSQAVLLKTHCGLHYLQLIGWIFAKWFFLEWRILQTRHTTALAVLSQTHLIAPTGVFMPATFYQ